MAAVRVDRADGIYTVTLHRPAERNAVDRPTATALAVSPVSQGPSHARVGTSGVRPVGVGGCVLLPLPHLYSHGVTGLPVPPLTPPQKSFEL
jgi:hypothetical protein